MIAFSFADSDFTSLRAKPPLVVTKAFSKSAILEFFGSLDIKTTVLSSLKVPLFFLTDTGAGMMPIFGSLCAEASIARNANRTIVNSFLICVFCV
ncbi:hypothetical protein D3C71_1665320 [compost metagenome]